MENDGTGGAAPTRREYLKFGSAVLGGGLLAGCTGGQSEQTPAGTATRTTASPERTSETEPYTVEMAPVGEVTFDSIPETWVAYTGDYADMGVALGRGDGLTAIGVRARFGAHHYEELPGVSVDKEALTQLWQDGTGKEVFYELDADVHIVDPNFMQHRLGWSGSDVAEVRDNVAPIVGNTGFTRVYDWHADYRYYTLYEAFEKLAELFQARDRYEAFAGYHDEVRTNVQSRLPSSTPDVAVLYPADVPPESFYPYLIGEGTQSKQWTDLRVGDALAKHGVTDAQAGGETLDYETLLEIDPDAIAVRIQGEITDAYFEENVVSHLRDHDVASQLTAVQDDRVFYGGLTYQGPILNLFQFEQAAQGLYPDVFGAEQLFDRQRVADIVNGEFDP
ncbi:ABC transporter substrate-binding protein [Halobellus sp. Atlit-38R]|uniref:ABC transporter substrate-binding protein n=1 Tax=Halobellus sp. Atlit-38R TaxID=2282131 RepID=UPI000EF29529|nr:ABC transporter substrate-binding protein [Halobellus sp. Atlit-38R]RLM90413.1 ABC transporter substrate-binding protein [Halobellus sp. Atlit-38R]